MKPIHRRDWEDINYTVRIEETHSHCFNFWLYPIVGFDQHGVPYYERIGSVSSGGEVEDISQAWCIVEGGIKWDGCCNFDTDGNGCMIHFCGIDEFNDFNTAMNRVYELVAEFMKSFSRDLAGLESS